MPTKPLLLITGEPKFSPFTHYLPEILAVEGYLCWDILDLREDEPNESALERRAVVLLGAVHVSERTQNLLMEFAEGGGALTAILPPRKMLSLLGIKALEGTYSRASDAYLCINIDHPWMQGFPSSSFQFHGDAQLYEPKDGVTLSFFAGQPDSPVPYPAVWVRQVEKGWVGLFAFDLAASVALTHQGVPRQRAYDGNPDRDRDGMFKPNDLFIGYLDPRLCMLPQADLQQELLVRLLRHTSPIPLPRLWYFPAAIPAAAVIRGDSDGMTRSDYDRTLAIADEFAARYTIQLMEQHLNLFSRYEVEALRARGHDFGIHPIFPLEPTMEEARPILDRLMDRFMERFGFIPPSHVAHSNIWPGWVDIPKHLEGLDLSLNFDVTACRFFRHGYLGGSGLPTRFIDENGKLINVFAQECLQSDDGYASPKTLLSPKGVEEVVDVTERILHDCVRFNTVYQACCHPINVVNCAHAEALMRTALKTLRRLAVPTFGAYEWVHFNRLRRQVSISLKESRAKGCKFSVRGVRDLQQFTLLLPIGGRFRLDGETVDHQDLKVRGEMWKALTLIPRQRDELELEAE